MYKVAAIAAIAIAALGISGCAPSAPSTSNGASSGMVSGGSFTEITVKLSGGRTVLCVRDVTGAGQSVSCDWAGAK